MFTGVGFSETIQKKKPTRPHPWNAVVKMEKKKLAPRSAGPPRPSPNIIISILCSGDNIKTIVVAVCEWFLMKKQKKSILTRPTALVVPCVIVFQGTMTWNFSEQVPPYKIPRRVLINNAYDNVGFGKGDKETCRQTNTGGGRKPSEIYRNPSHGNSKRCRGGKRDDVT